MTPPHNERGILLVILIFGTCTSVRYEPNWDSLDSRPLPTWFDEAKIGIFVHWGLFSVPSLDSAWFWDEWNAGRPDIVKYMKDNYPKDFTYADFAPMFRAEFYDPDEWADIFGAAGAKYVVFVAKHHEGFTNWPSPVSWNWNSMDVGPKRDLVGDLAAAVKKKPGMHFGVYHSLFEWFNPLYVQDRANGYKTQDFIKRKTMPELYELVNHYKPEVIWSDGDWDTTDVYWNATEFLAWLYNDSPVKDTVVSNDRWGSNVRCKHSGYLTCHDRFNPGVLVKHKWENAMTIDRVAFGFRRRAALKDYHTIEELIATIVKTISCGGNILMNVGPTGDGRIAPIFEERLRQIGSWLKVNGEAIYASKPWSHQNDTITPAVWYTSQKTANGTSVYAIVLKWPNDKLTLGSPAVTSDTTVTLVGYPGKLSWSRGAPSGVTIQIPSIPFNKMPCAWGWVFKLTGLAN